MIRTAALRFARMINLMIIVADNKSVSDKLRFMRNGMENLMKFIMEQGKNITSDNFDKIDVLFYEWSLALDTIITNTNSERNDVITARHLMDDLKKNKVRVNILRQKAPQPAGVPELTPTI